jgi:hypothetical protein
MLLVALERTMPEGSATAAWRCIVAVHRVKHDIEEKQDPVQGSLVMRRSTSYLQI